jgi:ABC-type transport system substrate-binding protein
MKKVLAVLLSTAMVVSLTACGGKSETTSASSDSKTETAATTAAAAATEAAQTTDSEPVSGGTLNIPITDDPTTLQGWMMRNTNEGVVAPAIYETLLVYDAAGTPQPWLLESFEGDADALTYTMVVKDGITFQDGTPLDADAVKWNLDYYKENGVLTGSYFNEVESVEKVDDKTVVVHMSSWNALFDYGLARTCWICSPAAVESLGADGFNEAPVGTGAFKVTKWEHGQGIYTEAYEDYWGGKPYLDNVNFLIYASTATQQAALEVGDLDVMNLAGDAVTAEALRAKGYNITNAAIPASGYTICFNSLADGPLQDVRVRQAIAYAVNSEAIAQALLGNGVYGSFSTQWALPTSAEYNDEVTGYGYDVEKAKELLKEAGYENGFDLTINFQVGDFAKNVCQIIQQQLADLKINVTLNQIEVANYANYLGEWDGILFHPMGLGNGQFSQVSANMIPGARFGSGTFLHDDKSVGLIEEAVKSDRETLSKDLKEAVKVLFQDNVELYSVAITYCTAVTNPKLHGDYGVVRQYYANWNELWKEAE